MAILIITLALLAIALFGIFYGMQPWRRVARFESTSTRQGALPKMSVIAYALRDEDDLSGYVDILLSQDYPDFEVILVCDASAEATAMLSEKFENTSNLHLTFIPPGSHNLSRRKLAQTLGIKRAAGEVVVTTCTSVLPRSDQWLRSLAEPFADRDINVVCGYVHPRFRDFTGPAKWYRQFDSALTSAQWMAEAVEGKPYRGDGYNLAFRRHLFFEAKGYATTLTLMDGDDDIFLNEICSPGRGCMVLSPQSMADTRWGAEANRIHTDLKDRYAFTRKYLPKGPFLRAALLSWTQWITTLGTVAMTAVMTWLLVAHLAPGAPGDSFAGGTIADDTSLPLIGFIIANSLIFIGYWLTETFLYRALATRLGAVRLFWAVLPFMLWRPIGNFLFFLNHYPTRKNHFTWART